MPVKRRHGRLGWWAVQPLSSAFHRVLRRPSLCDEQRQEDEELLRIVLEELLCRICGGRGTICQRISKITRRVTFQIHQPRLAPGGNVYRGVKKKGTGTDS